MDWNDTPAQAAFRNRVRQLIATRLPARYREMAEARGGPGERQWEFDRKSDDPAARAAASEWHGALAANHWVAPQWPAEYGGGGLSSMEQFVLNQELARAGAPGVGGSGVSLLGPTLIVHGTEEQKQQYLPSILNAGTVWAQGYSEPGAGSDLAGLQTRAIRDGDDFVINGQKIWTSGAHTADWMFMLARTDPDAPKHRGITYFLMDMKSPGVTVRPLINMGNMHNFNEVFFEDVRVPARNVLGEIDRGWYIGTTTLDFERSSIGNSVGQRQTLEYYLRYIKQNNADVSGTVKGELADRWIEAMTAKNLSYRVITIQAEGRVPNHEASIAKMFNTELSQRIARTAMKVLGTAGQLTDAEQAPMKGRVAASYLATVSSTIAGGTSEIQRNIVATRGLGLPRA